MVDLKLENDEGIIRQANNIEMYKTNDVYEEIYEMYLTNKNIICYYEKSNGLFAKSEEIIEKIPLQSIRIVNSKLQISKVDDDENGLGLQILLQNGERVYFVFEKKKELQIWYDAIFETITGEKIENNTTSKKSIKEEKSMIGGFLGVVQTVKDKEEKVKESMNSGEKKGMYCSNCGEKLIPNSKFCNYCGTPTDNTKNEENMVEEKKIETSREELTERKMVYEGKIHKCPNCGAILQSFTSACPFCGYELRDLNASSSLNKFSIGLEKITSKPLPEFKQEYSLLKKAIGKDFKSDDAKEEFERRAEETREEEIANYITKYPIPNSKEDLMEFMILATNSINIKASSDDIVKKAWLSKMNQIMQKAKITLKNSKDLEIIQKLYNEKLRTINIQKYQTILLVAIFCTSYFALFGFLVNTFIGIAILLAILSILFFIYGLVVGNPVEILNLKFKKKIFNFICLIMIITSGILGIKGLIDYHNSPEQQAIQNYYDENIEKYSVNIDIDFIENLFFNKYNVDIKVYDKTTTLHHGEDKTLNYQLPKGEHTIKFTGDGIEESVTLKVEGNTYVKYQLSCHGDEIKVQEMDYSIE